MTTARQLRFFIETGQRDLQNHPVYSHPNVSIDVRLDSRYTTDGSGYVNFGTETDPLALSQSLLKILQRKSAQLNALGYGPIGNRFHVICPVLGNGVPVGSFAQEGYFPLCRSLSHNQLDRKTIFALPFDVARMISADGIVSGGNFTVTCNGSTTGNIAWNATPSTFAAAVGALAVLSGNTVTAFSNDPIDYAGNVPLPGNVFFMVKNGGGAEVTGNFTWSINPSGLTGGGAYRLAIRPNGKHAFDRVQTWDFSPLNWHGRQAQSVLAPFFARFPQDIRNAGFQPLQLFQITSESGTGDNVLAFNDVTSVSNTNGWLSRLMLEPEWDGKDPRFFVDGARLSPKAFWDGCVAYAGGPLPPYDRNPAHVGSDGGLAGRTGYNHEPTLASTCMANVSHSFATKVYRDMLNASSHGTRIGEYTVFTCDQGAAKSVLFSPNTIQPGYLHSMRGLLPGHDCQCPELAQGMMEWYGSAPLDSIGVGTGNNWAGMLGLSPSDPNLQHKVIVATDLANIRAMHAANPSKPVIPYMTANIGPNGFLNAQQIVDEVLTPLIADPTGQKIAGVHYFAPDDGNPTNMTARWDFLQEIITRLNSRFNMVGDGSFTGVTGQAGVA